ncbi:MAG: hypothetical protein N2246_08760 [Candidatus Sumerlaeia bacterium]|nr:hypothetical protein [Candidatus Sumerlaeia bacterium]
MLKGNRYLSGLILALGFGALIAGVWSILYATATVTDSKALFETKCSRCHPLSRSLNKELTQAEWLRIVKRMQNKDRKWISDQEVEQIVAYLVGRSATPQPKAETEKLKEITPESSSQLLAEASERGKKIFADPALGTNGKTCNSCHLEFGRSEKPGPLDAKNFLRKDRFPKYVPRANRVMTLDQMIQLCITTQLAGKPLNWDDSRLTDLAVYVNSLYQEVK